MVVLIVSPPSRRLTPLLAVARGLMQSLPGGAEYLHLTTLERFKEDWARRQSDNLVLFLDCPDLPLARVLANVAVPILFLAEDPLESARHLIQSGRSVEDAARTVAACLASIEPIVVSAARLLRLTPEQTDPPSALRQRIAAFLDLSDDAAMAGSGAVSKRADETPRAAEPAANARWLHDALDCFRNVSHLRPVQHALLPIEMFLRADPLGAPYDGERLDLLGAARILLYGPYLHLPAGRWRAHLRLDVVENHSGNLLKIEMMNGHDVIAQSLGPLPAEGSFVASIAGRIAEPREPLQIRLSIQQGAIEGALALGPVEMRKLDEADATHEDP